MNVDLSQRLSLEYENYWNRELAQVADGWAPALVDLWWDLDSINDVVRMSSDHRISWVSMRYAIYPAGMMAHAAPLAHIRKWTPDHAMALIAALDRFHRRIDETCEECGNRSGIRRKTQLGIGGNDRILCDECNQRAGARAEQRE